MGLHDLKVVLFYLCSGSKFSAIRGLRCDTVAASEDTVFVGYLFLFCREDCQCNSRGKNVENFTTASV